MSKFNHNFYLDIRKPLKSGKYSIKVNLYDSELKQTSSFTIKKVAGIEVSSSKKDINWLPSGTETKFHIILRVYNPYESIYKNLESLDLPIIKKIAK